MLILLLQTILHDAFSFKIDPSQPGSHSMKASANIQQVAVAGDRQYQSNPGIRLIRTGMFVANLCLQY